MLQFNRNYFILTLLLFAIEVAIALYVHDNLIRPYFGDVLVVILLYCFVKSILKFSVKATAIYVLCFAFVIETLQYFNLVKMLGLEHNKLARIVIGTSFAWEDIGSYLFGIIIVLFVEKLMVSASFYK